MRELTADPANAESDGVEESVDVWLGGGTGGPPERDGFALAIFGENGGGVGGIEGEKENAKLARVGGGIAEGFLELSDVLHAGGPATGEDRDDHQGKAGGLREVMRRVRFVGPINLGDGAPPLGLDLNYAGSRMRRDHEHEHNYDEEGTLHGFVVKGTGLSGV